MRKTKDGRVSEAIAGKPETAGTRSSFNRRQALKDVTNAFTEIIRTPGGGIAREL